MTPDTPAAFLDLVQKWLPLVGALVAALGLWHVLAALLRKAWDAVKVKVLKSPTKLDDAVVNALNPGIDTLIKLIDDGKVDEVKNHLVALKKLAPK